MNVCKTKLVSMSNLYPSYRFLVCICMIGCSAVFSQGDLQAQVYGLKTCGSDSAACGTDNMSVVGDSSIAPTSLFSMDAIGTVLHSVEATLNGMPVHADGLSIDSQSNLFGYLLETLVTNPSANAISTSVTGSTLVTFDDSTGAATLVGQELAGRNIRAAAFDTSDRLWVVDVNGGTNDDAYELLEVDSSTGAINTTLPLSIGGTPLVPASSALSTIVDIVFDANGDGFLIQNDSFHVMDTATGELAPFGTGTISGATTFVGLAYSTPGSLWGLEVAGPEDVYAIDASNSASLITSNVVPTLNGLEFNSGRGDLAAMVVPEPCGFLIMTVLATLVAAIRRRWCYSGPPMFLTTQGHHGTPIAQHRMRLSVEERRHGQVRLASSPRS